VFRGRAGAERLSERESGLDVAPFSSSLRGVSQRGSGRGGFFGEYWAWVPVRDVV
jgi:hypothetical protein